MKLKALVLREWVDKPYVPKGGGQPIVPHVLTCFEQGEEPLLNSFDYNLREDEMKVYGTSQGKMVEFSIQEFGSQFGGRQRLKGRILSVDGKAVTHPK